MKDLLYIIILFALCIAVISWAICEVQNYTKKVRQKETKYLIMEENLKTIIETWSVNEKSYNAILVFFGKIYEHQGKTKWMIERTHVLYNRFVEKYATVSREIQSQDEFSPSEIFSEYN